MHIKQLISLTLYSSLIVAACLSNVSIADSAKNAAEENMAQQHSGVFTGELVETFNSGGYTYVQLKTDKGLVWAAGPKTTINKSDKLSFIGKVAMFDFYSKSLDRRFKTIYFVDSFIINGVKTDITSIDPHKKLNKKQAAPLKKFAKAKNGQDIAGILKNKDSLAGKTVKVRGQVSKYTSNVMGKNWLHIRDSSSDQDITITTDTSAKLDDIILVEGPLVLNKDYGYGYVYEVLIEDAKATVEPAK